MEWLKVVFCVGALVVLFEGSSALQCYECTSMDEGCQDEFVGNGAITKKTCSFLVTACSKVKSENKVTSRGCATRILTLSDGCHGVFGEITCNCSSDLCNGSTSVSASISILAALLLVVGILTWV